MILFSTITNWERISKFTLSTYDILSSISRILFWIVLIRLINKIATESVCSFALRFAFSALWSSGRSILIWISRESICAFWLFITLFIRFNSRFTAESWAVIIVKENNNSDNVKFLSIWFIISYLGLNNEFNRLNLAQITSYRHYLFILWYYSISVRPKFKIKPIIINDESKNEPP